MYLLWKNRNFLFLFLGRLVTNVGDSIYYVAAMWLVYDLGGSAFYSGLAGFLTLLPVALRFLTGPFVDRWNIRTTLITTQLLQCGLILIIPFAYYFNILSVELILLIMPVVSFIEQFAYPAQTKALPTILTKKELLKGNSLFSVAYQGVDLIFNSVSGILVAIVGAVSLFLVDSVTFAVATLLFALIKLPAVNREKPQSKQTVKQATASYFHSLKEGITIVFRSLFATFLLAAIFANFAIGAAQAVLPAFADMQGGAYLYGLYLTAMSGGALIGALSSSWFGRFAVGKLAIICFFISGGLWVLAPFIPNQILGIVLFGSAWVPVGATNVMFASVSQTVIPHHLLGRVNAVSGSMSVIAMPVGSLVGGALASTISPMIIFSITGSGLLIVALVWLVHPVLRTLPKTDSIDAATFRLEIDQQQHSLN